MTLKINMDIAAKGSQLELCKTTSDSESSCANPNPTGNGHASIRKAISRTISQQVLTSARVVRSKSIETTANKIRIFKTFVMCCIFFVMAFSTSLVGPTLLDLQIQVSASLIDLNWIFSINALGYMSGTLIAAYVLHKFNIPLCLATFVLFLIITNFATPWMSTLWSLFVISCLMNMAGGALDTGCNYWTLKLWGDDNAPYMQALHFTFGLGSLMAPLLSESFLLVPESEINLLLTNDSIPTTNLTLPDVSLASQLRIHYPYEIAGGLCILVACLCVGIAFLKKNPLTIMSFTSVHKTPLPKMRKILTIFSLACFSAGFSGVETILPRYLTTFAVKSDFHMSSSQGAFITSAFWFAYAFSRLGSIYLAPKMGPKRLLIANMGLIVAGNLIMIMCGSFDSPLASIMPKSVMEYGLWTGVITVGVGSSSVFPLQYGLLEQIMPVTAWMASCLTLVFSCGTFTYPLVVGSVIESTPNILFYITTACSFWSCACLAAFIKLGRVQN